MRKHAVWLVHARIRTPCAHVSAYVLPGAYTVLFTNGSETYRGPSPQELGPLRISGGPPKYHYRQPRKTLIPHNRVVQDSCVLILNIWPSKVAS